MMEAWYGRETDSKSAPAKKVESLRDVLLRTYEEAEHARGCALWQGRECNCFLADVAKVLGRDRRV